MTKAKQNAQGEAKAEDGDDVVQKDKGEVEAKDKDEVKN